MEYILNKISSSELDTLNNLVSDSLNNHRNPKLGRTDEYLANSTFFRPVNNRELVDFINNITGFKTKDITSFFHVRYGVGDKLPKHRDRSNHDVIKNPKHSTSYSFLLKMCDDGGEFMLDDKVIDFTQPGQYISFDGEDIFHEIKEVKSGSREVLVVWYKPYRESTII